MQVGDGPNQREILIQTHHRLLSQLGQRHDHIFTGTFDQEFLLLGQMVMARMLEKQLPTTDWE